MKPNFSNSMYGSRANPTYVVGRRLCMVMYGLLLCWLYRINSRGLMIFKEIFSYMANIGGNHTLPYINHLLPHMYGSNANHTWKKTPQPLYNWLATAAAPQLVTKLIQERATNE